MKKKTVAAFLLFIASMTRASLYAGSIRDIKQFFQKTEDEAEDDGTRKGRGGSLEERGNIALLQSVVGRHGGVAIAVQRMADIKSVIGSRRSTGSLDPASAETLAEVKELLSEELIRRSGERGPWRKDSQSSVLLLHGGIGIAAEHPHLTELRISTRPVGSLDTKAIDTLLQ